MVTAAMKLKDACSLEESVVCVSLSGVSNSATPWTVACQAPLSMEFSRQEYLGGLPFPSAGDLPDAGMEPGSPALQKTWIQSLGWKDPLEKGMSTHSSTLAWRIPWTEEPNGLQSTRLQE